MRTRAEEIQIGDTIQTEQGLARVTGWFLDAKGHVVLEYNDRWNVHDRHDWIMKEHQ